MKLSLKFKHDLSSPSQFRTDYLIIQSYKIKHYESKYYKHKSTQSAATHRGVNIEVLYLSFKLIHDSRDFLEIHGAQSFVQGFGHLTHVFSHLGKKYDTLTV